jgi:hypothetical protein
MEGEMIKIQRKQIVIGLFMILSMLFIANDIVHVVRELTGHDNLLGASRLFNFYEEANIPTWYSGCLLGISAALLSALFFLNRTRSERYHWLALACLFAFLSMDEVGQVHEFIGSLISRTKAQDLLPTQTSSAWVFWGGGLTTAVIAVFWKFWWRLAKDIRWLFFFAALTYVGGALGFEIIEIIYTPKFGVNLGFYLLSTIEETMEMAGVIIFISALLKQICRNTHFYLCITEINVAEEIYDYDLDSVSRVSMSNIR